MMLITRELVSHKCACPIPENLWMSALGHISFDLEKIISSNICSCYQMHKQNSASSKQLQKTKTFGYIGA